MVRNYEVHIDGKSFIIGERPEFQDLPANWLGIRVESAEELVLLKALLTQESGILGIHAFGSDVEQLWDWFREAYQFVQAAGGAVSDGNHRLLVIHRLGRWDLPKGKVEPHETIEDAAIREVEEECGLKTVRSLGPLCQTWHTYERNGRAHLKRTDWFLMTGNAFEPLIAQAEEDIDQVKWMDGEGLSEIRRDTYPSILKVLNAWAAHPGPA